MADVLVTPKRELPWAQLGQMVAQPMQQQQAIMQTLAPLLFKAQLETQSKRAELDYQTQKDSEKFERNLSLFRKYSRGGDLKLSMSADGGLSISEKSPTEKAQEKTALESEGISSVLPRFSKYALHEAGTEEPGIATQRIGQLQSKLTSQYPSQMDLIKSVIGGFTPPKTGGKQVLNPQNLAKGMAQMFKNTEEAAPTSETEPWKQRLAGTGMRLGAKYGIGGITPKQTAEIASMKVRARSFLKNFENNRFTDKDIEQAVEAMTDVGKTTPERLATIVNVVTAASAANGISAENIMPVLSKELSMSLEDISKITSGSKFKRQRNTRTGAIRLVPIGE